jgi:hypothetical protein
MESFLKDISWPSTTKDPTIGILLVPRFIFSVSVPAGVLDHNALHFVWKES